MLKCLLLPHVALLSKHLDGCVGYPSLALNASCSPLLAKSQRVFGHLIALLPGPSSLGTLWYSVSESLPGCVAVVGMTTGRINQVAIVAGAGPSLCEGNGRR